MKPEPSVGGISVGATPAATYNAVLTESAPCEFTVEATWKNAKIDQVIAIWTLDGVAYEDFLFTTEARATGPDAGAFKRRVVKFYVGPLASTSDTHTVYARVQFYSKGAHQFETLLERPAYCTRHV